jgi:hypothetical protein
VKEENSTTFTPSGKRVLLCAWYKFLGDEAGSNNQLSQSMA